MNIKKLFKTRTILTAFGLIIAISILSPTLVRAANSDDVQEVSYDDLVNELHRKKKAYTQNAAANPLDTIKLHAGLGLITSANEFKHSSNNGTKYQNGFQLSVGIDLFSPEWAAEAALRNFGQANSGSETRSLREFDLKMMNRGTWTDKMGYRLGAGLGTRYLKLSDSANGTSIDDSTPTALIFAGFDAFASKSLSLGIEGGIRTSLVNNTADRGAADLMIRLDTYF